METIHVLDGKTSNFIRKRYQRKARNILDSKELLLNQNSTQQKLRDEIISDSLIQNSNKDLGNSLNSSLFCQGKSRLVSRTCDFSTMKEYFLEISKTRIQLFGNKSKFQHISIQETRKVLIEPDNKLTLDMKNHSQEKCCKNLKIATQGLNPSSSQIGSSIRSNSSDSTPHQFTSYQERLCNLLLKNFL